MSAFALPAALWLARRFMPPVNRVLSVLHDGISSLLDSDFSVSIAETRGDELGCLVQACNRIGHVLRGERQELNQRELLLDTVIQGTPPALVLTNTDGVSSTPTRRRALFLGGGALEGRRLPDLLQAAPVAMAEAVELEIRCEGDRQRLRVPDRGTGMSEAVMNSALLPCYSTKRAGSAPGLPLCRELVEAHGGRLSLSSRSAGGWSSQSGCHVPPADQQLERPETVEKLTPSQPIVVASSVIAPREAQLTSRAYLRSSGPAFRVSGVQPARRRSRVPASTSRRSARAGASITIRSPSATSAMGPPAAASGATWPTTKPWLPPEKRPSVISATSWPRPRPMMAEVGLSISRIPGPPRGPS